MLIPGNIVTESADNIWLHMRLYKIRDFSRFRQLWSGTVYSKWFSTSVRFLRRPVGPRPATLLSGLQLQKCVGPVGRQLLYLPCGAEWCTTVNGHWRNKILFKRYTFSYDPNQHCPLTVVHHSAPHGRYKSCLPTGPTHFWSCRPDSKVAGLGPTGRRKNRTLITPH